MFASRRSSTEILAAVSSAAKHREYDKQTALSWSEISWLRKRHAEEDAGRRVRVFVAGLANQAGGAQTH